MADAKKPADTRSAQQIRDDIRAARARMSANVEGLVNEVHPTAVKQRTIDDVKQTAKTEVQHLTYQVKDEDGWRTDRFIAAGMVAGAATIGLLIVRGFVKLVTRKR